MSGDNFVELTKPTGCCRYGALCMYVSPLANRNAAAQIGDEVWERYTCSGNDYTKHMTIIDITPEEYVCQINETTVGDVPYETFGLSKMKRVYPSGTPNVYWWRDDDDKKEEVIDDDAIEKYHRRLFDYARYVADEYPIGMKLSYRRS
jgi:hypothetical protein